MQPSSRCAECGAGLPVAAGEPVVVCSACGRVAFLERGGRSPTTPLPFVEPGCRDLTGGMTTAVASHDDGEHVAGEAIDGHRGSMWSSGRKPPVWWCVDLGEIQPIRGVTVVPVMQPAIGRVLHVVETCAAGEDWSVHVTIDQTMTDAGVYSYAFATPVDARWLRIRTESSISNVGWYEIGIFG